MGWGGGGGGGWELRVCVAGINLTNLSCRFVAVAAGPFLAACDPFVTFDKKIAEITAESLRGGFWAVLGRLAASANFWAWGLWGLTGDGPGRLWGPHGACPRNARNRSKLGGRLLEIPGCCSKFGPVARNPRNSHVLTLALQSLEIQAVCSKYRPVARNSTGPSKASKLLEITCWPWPQNRRPRPTLGAQPVLSDSWRSAWSPVENFSVFRVLGEFCSKQKQAEGKQHKNTRDILEACATKASKRSPR